MADLLPFDLRQSSGAALLARVRGQTSPQLAALATRLERTFLIRAPLAPGFCCLGAEIALGSEAARAYGATRLSATGNGEAAEEALIGCLGETADRLSHVARPEDIRETNAVRDPVTDGWIGQVLPGDVDGVGWMRARNAANGSEVALPADLCVRRPSSQRLVKPAGALSVGVAAGPDFAAAALRAGLELCERDAAALWWLGGQRPRAFPAGHPAERAGATLIAALRQGRTDRATHLFDITTELDIPAVAAVSVDRDGYGLACGLAARLDWGGAARAAVLELCQMELAAPMAQAKRRERGEAALNEIDRGHLRRATFATHGCDLLAPRELSSKEIKVEPAGDPLRAFVSHLDRRGARLFVVDLTRPDIDIPVVRMVSPDLQPYTADVVTERFRRCRASNGAVDARRAPVSVI